MKRKIEVKFNPERNDPYCQDYEIRISSDPAWTVVTRLTLDEATELSTLLNKVLNT